MATENDSIALRDVQLELARGITARLFAYCEAHEWAGYDPYDALNSRLFRALPFLNFKFSRLVLTQLLKRSPLNFRPLLLVPKTHNPKGLALFLESTLMFSKLGIVRDDSIVRNLIEKILALRDPNNTHWCWGYNFPWQTRTVFVPGLSANLVTTVFVADALLSYFEKTKNTFYLEIAASAGQYLARELFWRRGSIASFAYGLPESRIPVYNANLLGAALLYRLYRHTGVREFLTVGQDVARYSASKQRPDGSWVYGEGPTQNWIDNFHTGYNLCALRSIGKSAETDEFEPQLKIGWRFYREHFFREDSAPRYYHNNTFPIDVHCSAQSILTLLEFSDSEPENVSLARALFSWTAENMWSEQGYFFYQKNRFYMNRICYIRWSQAWMLRAGAALIAHSSLRSDASTDQQMEQRSR